MRAKTSLVVLALTLSGWVTVQHPALAAKDASSPIDAKQAEKLVQDRLAELKGAGAKVDLLTDSPVQNALPGQRVFSVLYRQYPVGRIPPKPLRPQNLFVVDPKGKLQLITDAKGLEKFFRASAKPVQKENEAKDAGLAWLRLVQEFHQDGFYKFKPVKEATKVTGEKEGKKVTARSVVMAGGNGEIQVALTFDAEGKLVKAAETSKIKQGPRPICQATKLLDPDPLVRRICEQDLLIMGTAAKDYLAEQRAKAGPELRRAIDHLWERILAQDRK
jgi:hypothetical protein